MTFSTCKRLLLLQTLCVLIFCILLILHQAPSPVHSFGNFVLPKHIFGTNSFFTNPTTTTSTVVRTNIEAKKLELLNAIRGTNNGKNATPQQQIQILQLVRNLEMTQPNISIRDPTIVAVLNGTWYLQYTSPSMVEVTESTTTTTSRRNEDDDNENDTRQSLSLPTSKSYVWQPNQASLENVETRRFNAQGTVSAAGITIDTSNNTLVQQIFDTETSTVMNRIYFTNNKNKATPDGSSSTSSSNTMNKEQIKYAVAGGTYRPSTVQPNRAIVAFNTAQIHIPTTFRRTVTIPLGWFFSVLALFRKGNRENGWLETTYIDPSLRIGRGNKGTMFVLTREPLSLS